MTIADCGLRIADLVAGAGERAMVSSKDEFRARTKAYALRVIQLVQALPHNAVADVIGKQLVRSATSVGANYRACCNARSRVEFIAKLGVVVEEIDESLYWLEVITGSEILSSSETLRVHGEAAELRAIFAKSLGTARANLKRSKSK